MLRTTLRFSLSCTLLFSSTLHYCSVMYSATCQESKGKKRASTVRNMFTVYCYCSPSIPTVPCLFLLFAIYSLLYATAQSHIVCLTNSIKNRSFLLFIIYIFYTTVQPSVLSCPTCLNTIHSSIVFCVTLTQLVSTFLCTLLLLLFIGKAALACNSQIICCMYCYSFCLHASDVAHEQW